MQTSLSTACLYHLPLRRVFSLVADVGFDGIELVMAPEVWLRGCAYVRSLSAEYRLPVLSVHQTILRFSPSGLGAKRMVDATQAALALGASVIVIHTPHVLDWGDPRARDWLQQLRRCRDLIGDTDVRLTLENPGWYGETSKDQLLAQVPILAGFARWHGLDITLDTCHVGTYGTALHEAYAQVAEDVVNVHLSDLRHLRLPLDAHHLRTCFSRHQLPGDGHLRLGSFISHLAQVRYDGLLTLEIGAIALGAWSLRRVRARLSRALDYVRVAWDLRPATPEGPSAQG